MTKLNSGKFCFLFISIRVQELNKFLKPGDRSLLVLNFWAYLSLGVLIKFVLIKKEACNLDWRTLFDWNLSPNWALGSIRLMNTIHIVFSL